MNPFAPGKGGLLDPNTLGLLGLASGLGRASGPSRMPVGFGAILGEGVQGGMQGYQQGLQFQELDRKRIESQKQQDQINEFAKTLPEDQRQRFMIDPSGYLKATAPKAPEPFTLPAGGIRYGADGKPIAQAPMKPGDPSPLAKLLQEQGNFAPGTDQWKIYQQAIERQSSHAPAATITNTNAPVITAGNKEVDKNFAQEHVTFATGGYADTQKQLDQLREVSANLGKAKPGSLTGTIVGNLPDTVRAAINPQAQAAQDAVEEVVQRNLRLVLGAQFTNEEGKRLIARAYNPKLPEAENKKRVDRLISQISEAAESKLDASRYFMANGTLQGWKGKVWSMKDFDPEKGETKTQGGKQSVDSLLEKYR